MERSLSWLTFCAAGTLTRTVVHFFPSSGGVSAPYPANCKLSVFGAGIDNRSVSLDGAKLSQPDGLWLDDAFPQLRESSGIFGLLIELSSSQPRIDISPSGCVMELHSPLQTSRFWPVRVNKAGEAEMRGPVPLVRDPFNVTCLVFMNGGDLAYRPSANVSYRADDGSVKVEPLDLPEIAPRSAMEVPIQGSLYDKLSPQQCSFGLVRLAGVALRESLPPLFAAAAIFRDSTNGYPISVCTL